MTNRCKVCGQDHDGLPDVGADKPDQWWGVPENERDSLITLTKDTCIIGDDYFIRGVIEIPIHEYRERFGFGVWVSQKKENFLSYVQNPESADIGPFFGWLCTRIAYYEDNTRGLKTMAHFSADHLRPTIELEPTEHPLAVDQREGITLDRAWEIVHFYQRQ